MFLCSKTLRSFKSDFFHVQCEITQINYTNKVKIRFCQGKREKNPYVTLLNKCVHHLNLYFVEAPFESIIPLNLGFLVSIAHLVLANCPTLVKTLYSNQIMRAFPVSQKINNYKKGVHSYVPACCYFLKMLLHSLVFLTFLNLIFIRCNFTLRLYLHQFYYYFFNQKPAILAEVCRLFISIVYFNRGTSFTV